MTETAEQQDEIDETDAPITLPSRIREPDDLAEPHASDVTWPNVTDVGDMPIAAQYEEAMSALMTQCDAAIERIEDLYRTGIREIRELIHG